MWQVGALFAQEDVHGFAIARLTSFRFPSKPIAKQPLLSTFLTCQSVLLRVVHQECFDGFRRGWYSRLSFASVIPPSPRNHHIFVSVLFAFPLFCFCANNTFPHLRVSFLQRLHLGNQFAGSSQQQAADTCWFYAPCSPARRTSMLLAPQRTGGSRTLHWWEKRQKKAFVSVWSNISFVWTKSVRINPTSSCSNCVHEVNIRLHAKKACMLSICRKKKSSRILWQY